MHYNYIISKCACSSLVSCQVDEVRKCETETDREEAREGKARQGQDKAEECYTNSQSCNTQN